MRQKGSKKVGSMCGIREIDSEIEMVSRDERSSDSISSGILPSLGAHSNRRVKLRPFIVSPFDPRYRAWESFLIVLVFYTAWVSPFEFGFVKGPKGILAITDNIVNGFFAIDIVLTFFVAYLDKVTYLLIDSPKLIALRYSKTWLLFDVISTIPSELARKVLPSNAESYGYFSMLRLWRLRRVSAMFQSLCFAAERGDDLLLHHLLKRGLNPNELDSCGLSALHVAASKGSLECVLLLLDYGADPNRKDSEGNIPLWNAILGKHDSIIKLLADNGATLTSGDVGQFACVAVEQNSKELLNEIIRFGGDVTLLNSVGTTALHTAISEENVEIVKFLMEKGADIDKPDVHGWTPRALANYQGHEEIKALFQTKQEPDNQNAHHNTESLTSEMQDVPYLKKYSSEPTIPPMTPEDKTSNSKDVGLSNIQLRRRANNFRNSLAGIITAGRRQNEGGRSVYQTSANLGTQQNRVRVVVSCPEKGDADGKLVFLPKSFQELLDFGHQKFGFRATKILLKGGALIEDLAVIRDGDHLILAGDCGSESSDSSDNGVKI